jgi:hypothetical protein
VLFVSWYRKLDEQDERPLSVRALARLRQELTSYSKWRGVAEPFSNNRNDSHDVADKRFWIADDLWRGACVETAHDRE